MYEEVKGMQHVTKCMTQCGCYSSCKLTKLL